MPNKLWKDQWNAVALASVVLLVFSFAFGGASREHALRLALVELAALPLLALSARRLINNVEWREHRFALSLLACLLAIPLLQLVPLPPAVWTRLPGRAEMVLGLDLAGIAPGWSPLTLAADRTWASFLALTPPTAMFLAVLTTTSLQRTRLVALCLAGAVIGITLGAAQLASGGSALYPWATTGAGSVTGFFANRNHLASLLLVTIPFAVVMGSASMRRRGSRLPLWAAALFLGLVIVALAAIRSRAGLILFTPVTGASLLAAWIAAGRGRPAPALLTLFAVGAAALTAVAVLALPPILARFDTNSAPETRFERWPLVAEAAEAYLPAGAGIGSFDAVYRSVEPLDQLDSTFFNQAHNEYLETWLEAGWPGILLVLAFLVWYARRMASAWRSAPSRERDLQRAASIAIGALLLHSLGDYPLRTSALAVVFAMACGLLELACRPDRPATASRAAGGVR